MVAPSSEPSQPRRIHEAFVAGDLEALTQAVDDASAIPNGVMPLAIGSCLVYAIYHSTLAFIRTLLDLGADPNQRGLNDYTPLHMAVSEDSPLAAQMLLEAGADPDLPTRIDDCQTPLEMAQAWGRTEVAAILARRGRPDRRRLRAGLTILVDVPGRGEAVGRQRRYRVRLRLWRADGEPVRWPEATLASGAVVEDAGTVRIADHDPVPSRVESFRTGRSPRGQTSLNTSQNATMPLTISSTVNPMKPQTKWVRDDIEPVSQYTRMRCD